MTVLGNIKKNKQNLPKQSLFVYPVYSLHTEGKVQTLISAGQGKVHYAEPITATERKSAYAVVAVCTILCLSISAIFLVLNYQLSINFIVLVS